MTQRAWRWYAIASVAGLPVYFFAVHGLTQRVAFYVYGFSSVAAIVAGLRMQRPSRPWPWIAFAAGLFLFAVGDVVFDLYDAFGRSVPVPSVADYLYLAGYPVLAWGMVLLVRYRVRGADLASALDGVIVAVGVGVLAAVFVMQPYARDHTLSLGEQIVPIAYPALDLLLLAVAVRLVVSRGVRNPSFCLLGASVVALLVADGFFAVATLHDTYADGSFIEAGWLASYALWGAAALHPSMARLTDAARPSGAGHHRLVLALLTVAALTSPVTLVVQEIRGVGSDVILLSATSAVMFVLVLLHLSLATRALDASNHELATAGARQLVLTDAAVAFVTAVDVRSAAGVAARTAVALCGRDDAWSAFVAMSPSGPTVVAAAGPAPWPVGGHVDAELAADWYEPGAADRPVLLDPAGPHGRDATRCTRAVARVHVDGHIRGKLVAGTPGTVDSAVVSALGLVCSQMGLAVQSIEATEERLRARNERKFRSLVQNSPDVVTIIGPDGVVRFQSPGVRTMLGRDGGGLVDRTLDALIHPDDVAAARASLTKVRAGGLAATVNFECRVSHADGSWREVDTVITNLLDDPDVEAIVLNSRDVTDRRALERTLNRQAFHDALTGLPNRALFVDRVAHALDRGDREAAPVGVLFLDLDDFKVVNDSLGHSAGDQLLVAVGERLKGSCRPGDTVARFGGDEFALLVESGKMPEAAHAVAERVADALKVPIRIGSDDVTVRASIGIALGRRASDEPEGLLRDADLAMYMAKHNGKGRFEMFRPAMHAEAVQRLEMTAELRRGLERGELEVFYQPIVDAHTGTPKGAEALVRWHHARRGLVPPAEFIPIAESTGLIVPLGKWVLGEACRAAAAWRRSRLTNDAFYVSVNLSARQLQSPALLDDVAAALRESGLPARALVLEVTESVLMEDLDPALAHLQALKDLGLRLAVDDFGTGYSSLSYLRDLPMDVVKIDKSFVDRISLDTEGRAMVRSVIDMTAALGLVSIAEGVEREDQLAVLGQLGCDNVQGYLFAQPMPGDRFAETLAQLRFESVRRAPAAVERT